MGRPGPRKLGSKRPGRSRTSNTPGRSIKPTLQPRYATHLVRSRGVCGRRAVANSAKTEPARKTSSRAIAGATGVRATAWGERTGRVNWGPSAAGGLVPQPGGIIHNPLGGRQRRRCGHSKRQAGRTIQPAGEPRATGPAVVVRSSRCRLVARPTTGKTPGNETPTVTAYKRARIRPRRWPWRQAGLKPYWGKPTVRNFREGRGNDVNGLMTVCHAARKGGYIGSHLPNHVRASALLDGFNSRSWDNSSRRPLRDCLQEPRSFLRFLFRCKR